MHAKGQVFPEEPPEAPPSEIAYPVLSVAECFIDDLVFEDDPRLERLRRASIGRIGSVTDMSESCSSLGQVYGSSFEIMQSLGRNPRLARASSQKSLSKKSLNEGVPALERLQSFSRRGILQKSASQPSLCISQRSINKPGSVKTLIDKADYGLNPSSRAINTAKNDVSNDDTTERSESVQSESSICSFTRPRRITAAAETLSRFAYRAKASAVAATNIVRVSRHERKTKIEVAPSCEQKDAIFGPENTSCKSSTQTEKSKKRLKQRRTSSTTKDHKVNEMMCTPVKVGSMATQQRRISERLCDNIRCMSPKSFVQANGRTNSFSTKQRKSRKEDSSGPSSKKCGHRNGRHDAAKPSERMHRRQHHENFEFSAVGTAAAESCV